MNKPTIRLRYTMVLPIQELVMSCPGAKMSTTEPKFEKEARVSVMVEAPMVLATPTRAGLVLPAFALSFPAATFGAEILSDV